MSDDHVTVAFVTPEALLRFPCPTGADHDDAVPVHAHSCAWCLCGWSFTEPFPMAGIMSVDVAYTMAKMQAREHMTTVRGSAE